jgi:RNA polymerase sigma factor for flagellar operon FliA
MRGIASYQSNKQSQASNAEVVQKYGPLVKKIAYHLLSRLPKSIQLEDLVQSGIIGLLEANKRYDPKQDASFETYASLRIRGAMLDDLRRGNWMPRSAHRNMRRIAAAIKQVENKTGQPARAREIAAELGVSLDDYAEMASTCYANELVSLDSVSEDMTIADESARDPQDVAQIDNVKTLIAEHVRSFPEREQLVLSLYYVEELNFKEIGEVLGVTEARVCQLHGQIVARLLSKLEK